MPIGEGISGKEEGSPMADAAACDGGAGQGRWSVRRGAWGLGGGGVGGALYRGDGILVAVRWG
jgi:hypothetical protein